jgi:hypothetical protein
MSKSIVGLLVGKVIVNHGILMHYLPGSPESDNALLHRTNAEREIVAIADDLMAALEAQAAVDRLNDELYDLLHGPLDEYAAAANAMMAQEIVARELREKALAKARGEGRCS